MNTKTHFENHDSLEYMVRIEAPRILRTPISLVLHDAMNEAIIGEIPARYMIKVIDFYSSRVHLVAKNRACTILIHPELLSVGSIYFA